MVQVEARLELGSVKKAPRRPDRMIRRGDDIILSNPVKNISDVTGAFRQELDYLIQQGFRLGSGGRRMIR
jgi:hypothetical protein